MKNKILYILIFLTVFVLILNFCMISSINALAMGYPIEKTEVINQEIVNSGEEIVIEDAGLYFQLPSDEWKFTDRATFGDKSTMYVYKRKPIIDQSGTSVIPAICVNIDKLAKDAHVMAYSAYWTDIQSRPGGGYEGFKMKFRGLTGYIKEVSGLFTDMSLQGYLGQICTYNDPTGRQHTSYNVYLINYEISPHESIGIWLTMDVTTELLPIIKEEFMYTLKTIKFVEKQE